MCLVGDGAGVVGAAVGLAGELPAARGMWVEAVQETQEAIRRVLSGSTSEELPPAGPEVRRMQHEMARSANLVSHSYGSEPRRRVRIFQG